MILGKLITEQGLREIYKCQHLLSAKRLDRKFWKSHDRQRNAGTQHVKDEYILIEFSIEAHRCNVIY